MRVINLQKTLQVFRKRTNIIPFLVFFASVGVVLIVTSGAATPVADIEAENGNRNNVTVINDGSASGGQAIKFASASSGGTGGSGDYTGGSGGAKTNRLFQSFSSNGMTSDYHIFASGLDWTKDVGLLLYADGSGGYGFDNPNSTYLLDADGSNGLVAVAKKHNLLLLVPEAPAPDCDGYDNCWYNESTSPDAKAKSGWAFDLVSHVYSLYNIDKSRVAIGGYSSGAQFTSRWFVPLHGPSIQTGGVFVPIAYGGAPADGNNITSSYRNAVVGYWRTGTADEAYSSSSWGAIGGYNWYRNNGFTVDYDWPSGADHYAFYNIYDDIMDEQITTHVRAP